MRLSLWVLLLAVTVLFSQTSYRFAVLGDRTGSAQPGVFQKVCAQIIATKPAPSFVMNVGDLIQGYETDSVKLTQQWADLLKEMEPIKKAFPFHPVPGNHDIMYDNVLSFYERFLGQPYYAFSYGPDRFIVLDNSRATLPDKIDSTQMAFLRTELKQSIKARYIFCFFHQPMWKETPREPAMNSFADLLQSGGVRFVINGDWHRYVHAVRGNTHFITVGSSGGGADNKRVNGSLFQHVIFDVSPKGVEFRPVTIGNEIMPPDWVTDTTLQQITALTQSITLKKISLSTKDAGVPPGQFEIKISNPLKVSLQAQIKWDLNAKTRPFWNIEPVEGFLGNLMPADPVAFSSTYQAKGFALAPKVFISIPFNNDTLIIVKRPLIQKEIIIHRSMASVGIDGILNEACWNQGLKEPQSTYGNQSGNYDSTWIALAWDSDFLYGGFIAYDTAPESLQVLTPADVRDKCNFFDTEDVVQFFFALPGNDTLFYQNLFSPGGAIRDEIRTFVAGEEVMNNSWNGIKNCKIVKTLKGYQGEFAIAWTSLGLKGPQSLLFNSKRTNARANRQNADMFLQLPLGDPSLYSSAVLSDTADK